MKDEKERVTLWVGGDWGRLLYVSPIPVGEVLRACMIYARHSAHVYRGKYKVALMNEIADLRSEGRLVHFIGRDLVGIMFHVLLEG